MAPKKALPHHPVQNQSDLPPQTFDPVQTHLLKLVDDDSSFDEMVQALQSNPERLAAELLKLELEGLVVAQPGLRWRSL